MTAVRVQSVRSPCPIRLLSGTGKTEFVKYLGKALDWTVLVVKVRGLLSKYVGANEQNIANAFRLAEIENAILFFSEVDGLLQPHRFRRVKPVASCYPLG